VSNGVQEISRQNTHLRFVLLRTECWGGICGDWGQFILGGRVVVNEPIIAHPNCDGILRRLIGHFDVDIGALEIFPPLSRGFD
jgi:hypothetical protein